MKFIQIIILSTLFMAATLTAQTTITSVDLNKYSGKWFVIASIPTSFDKSWNYVTESYTVNKKGNIDIFTTYIKPKNAKEKSFRSKGFPNEKTNNVMWKVQFVWPFKADYLIEDLAGDYSYTIVGHPKKKILYIMNRTGKMPDEQYNSLVELCKQKGYDITQLRRMAQ